MSLHPIEQTMQLCSGCEPQMTPVMEETAFQKGVYFADQYIACDPRMQCCLAPPAGVKSASVRSWWSDLSLASGTALGALVMSRIIREAWNDATAAVKKAEGLRPRIDIGISIDAKGKINPLIDAYLEAAHEYDQLAYVARRDDNGRLTAYALGRQREMLSLAAHYNSRAVGFGADYGQTSWSLNGYRIEHARTKIALNARAIVREMLPALNTDSPTNFDSYVAKMLEGLDSEGDAARILAGTDILRIGRRSLAELDKFEDEAWKEDLMGRYNIEIEAAFSRSLVISEPNRKAVVERTRGEFYTEVMRYNLEWYKRARAKEWRQRYLNEARGYAEKAVEAFRSAHAGMMGEPAPTARDFLARIRILKRDAAVLETMSEVDKDFKRGDLEKVYKEIVFAAKQAVAEIERGDVVAKALDEKHLLSVALDEQVKAMEKLGQSGEEYYAATSRIEGPTLAVFEHLDLLNPEDREVALEALKDRAGMEDITTTSELMEALAFGRLRGALRKQGIASEVVSRLERSASDHLAVTLDLRRRDKEVRRAVK